MTDIVPVPAAPDVPQYPALGSANFNQEAYAVGTAFPGVTYRMWEIAVATHTNATAAKEQAEQARLSAQGAASESDAAMGYRNQAGQSATTATQQAQLATEQQEEATRQAGIATAQAEEATRQTTEATRQAGLSDTARQQAEAARDLSRNYRDQAQTFATQQIQGSSTTSVTPGAGSKTWVIEANRSFVPGMYLVATSTTTPGTRMSGYVSSYDAATGQLVIAVDEYSGSAASADWAIGVAARGADGMAQQVITADTTAVPGVVYIFAGDAVLTLPTTGLSDGDSIGIRLAVPVSYNQIVDFGSIPLRGQAAGERYLDKKGFGLDLKYNATLGEWI